MRFRWSRAVPRSQVLPGDAGPGRPLACRLRRDPCSHPGARERVRSWAWTEVSRSAQRCPPARCSPARACPPAASDGSDDSSASSPGPSAAANRRARVKLAVARLRAREADARKDWAEKLSTDLARRFDVIRVEDLRDRAT